MKNFVGFVAVVALFMICRPCCSRSVPEDDSVVSIYTTQPTTGASLDVYQQIANNLAERITSPIYRFLGLGKNKTEDQQIIKRPWEKIELLDEPEDVTKSANPVDNDIEERDTEELSVEALKKIDKKPEKVVLYSSYLPPTPPTEKLQVNMINEIDLDDDDDTFSFDDVEVDQKSRDGPFVYVLEWIGSLVQIAWGAIEAIFKPSKDTNNGNTN